VKEKSSSNAIGGKRKKRQFASALWPDTGKGGVKVNGLIGRERWVLNIEKKEDPNSNCAKKSLEIIVEKEKKGPVDRKKKNEKGLPQEPRGKKKKRRP